MATEKFHYKVGDREIVLPKMENLPSGLIRRLRKTNDLEMMYGLLEANLGDEDMAALDDLTMKEIADLYSAWEAGSETSMGESSGSSTS